MAGKTLIGGTEYTIKGGKALIGGTGYSISKGKTLIGGTENTIAFSQKVYLYNIGDECTSASGGWQYWCTAPSRYTSYQTVEFTKNSTNICFGMSTTSGAYYEWMNARITNKLPMSSATKICMNFSTARACTTPSDVGENYTSVYLALIQSVSSSSEYGSPNARYKTAGLSSGTQCYLELDVSGVTSLSSYYFFVKVLSGTKIYIQQVWVE